MRPVISRIHHVTALASDRQRIAGVDLTRIAMQNQINNLAKAVGIGTMTDCDIIWSVVSKSVYQLNATCR
jgi:hypothetical protein